MDNNELSNQIVDVADIYLCAYEENDVVKFGYFTSGYYRTSQYNKKDIVQLLVGFDNNHNTAVLFDSSKSNPRACDLYEEINLKSSFDDVVTYISSCKLISILGSYDDLRTDKKSDYSLGVATRKDMERLRTRIQERIFVEALEFDSTNPCPLYKAIVEKGLDKTTMYNAYRGPRDYQLTKTRILNN